MTILQQLAAYVDRPHFPWKNLIVGFILGQLIFESILGFRQYKVLQRKKPPRSLEGEISQETFDKSQAYGRAKAEFKSVTSIYSLVQALYLIYSDAYLHLWVVSGKIMASYAPASFSGDITQSAIFFIFFTMIQAVLAVPTSLFENFVLEEKFGFNKLTIRTFVADFFKGQALVICIGAPVIGAILAIIDWAGNDFYIYVWAFNIALQLFMITIHPIVILPLFNKLSPLEDGPLKEKVEALSRRLQFPLTNLFVIDGSKRSAHSNAYFFGLPWKKHIVIYDTLIEKSETAEIEAVLGHELGHWSLSHTIKLFGVSQFHSFYVLALFSIFIRNSSLYEAFGFHQQHPVFVGLILFNEVFQPLDMIIKFSSNIVSRKFEFEADAFAVKLGYANNLARSLIRLQIQNLSTMDADWLYATYHYSHPILPERLNAIGWTGEKSNMDHKPSVIKAGDREL